MSKFKRIKNLLEYNKNFSAKDVVNILSNPKNFDDLFHQVKLINNKEFAMAYLFHSNGAKRLEELKSDWKPGGTYFDYFIDAFGAGGFIITDEHIAQTAKEVPSRWRNLSKRASSFTPVVSIKVKVV